MVHIDRTSGKPTITRGADGSSVTLRPQGLVGPAGPGGSDAGVAGYVNDTVSLTTTALKAAYATRALVSPTLRRAGRDGTVIDDFTDVGTRWALASGTLTQVTTPRGRQGMRVTTVSGGTSQPQREFTVDMTGKFLSFEFRALDANLSRVDIILCVNGRSSNVSWQRVTLLDNNATANAKSYIDGVPKRVTVPMSMLAAVGGATAITDIRQIRLSVIAKTGTVTAVEFSDLRLHSNPLAPGIVVQFDDARDDTYTRVFPIMNARGLVGDIAVPTGLVGTVGTNYSYMTWAQLQEMQTAGWSMSSHTVTHLQLAGQPLATVQSELRDSYNALIANGLSARHARHFVYPGGSFDDQSRRQCELHYRTARTVQDVAGVETPYQADLSMLRTSYASPTRTLAQKKAVVDALVARGGVSIMVFHSILDADPGGGRTDWWLTSDFTALMDYIVASGLAIYHPDDLYPSEDAQPPVAEPPAPLELAPLKSGEGIFPRHLMNGVPNLPSGAMRLTYFTARQTETANNVRVTVGTGAGATPTISRIGVYEVAGDGTLTLIASTANDTALFTTGTTSQTRALTAPFKKVAGRRYAVGFLVVTTAAAPTVGGIAAGVALELGSASDQRISGNVTGLADLPATVAPASILDTTQMPYAALLP